MKAGKPGRLLIGKAVAQKAALPAFIHFTKQIHHAPIAITMDVGFASAVSTSR